MYENAKYIINPINDQNVVINVVFDGKYMSIPIDDSNIDYQNVMKAVAEGKLTIAPAEETN